ncbi:MAG: helix-turn-helix transcriptional regulator [Candidatus Woesearchaeota archaeon]
MKNSLIKFWLIIGIFSGFATLVFFLMTYLTEKILCNLECREKNEVMLILILLSLFGLFVGSLLYYFISEKHRKEIVKISKDAGATLNFLEPEMKKIVESIIKRNGSATQSQITKDTQINKVKISRLILKLEERNILKKFPNGMTNIISLNEEFKELFLNS